jgi:hypothetical protein
MREMPKCAKCQNARNPEEREIPNGAESRTATNGGTPSHDRRFSPFRILSPFGIPRSSGFRALRDSALSGISRR